MIFIGHRGHLNFHPVLLDGAEKQMPHHLSKYDYHRAQRQNELPKKARAVNRVRGDTALASTQSLAAYRSCRLELPPSSPATSPSTQFTADLKTSTPLLKWVGYYRNRHRRPLKFICDMLEL